MAKQTRLPTSGAAPVSIPKEARPVPHAVVERSNAQGKVTTALMQLGYGMASCQRASENVLTGPIGILVVGAHSVKVYRGELLGRNFIRQASTSSLASLLTLTGDFDEFITAVQRQLGGAR